jgi:hypothetical protein
VSRACGVEENRRGNRGDGVGATGSASRRDDAEANGNLREPGEEESASRRGGGEGAT